jgi:hypothetical protein
VIICTLLCSKHAQDMRKNNANREREKQEEKKGESTEYSE